MSLFGRHKEEYKPLYDDDFDYDPDFDPTDPDENEDVDAAIEKLRGTIQSGDCLYCNGKNTMKYDGYICFICDKCKMSMHEDMYYRWAAGYPVEFEE